ncbi:hypothetical protein V5799_017785 [Amblyomma americanum]|uniref:Uncharacterized protein n=1 Tax=Amblyomma americanum TaxID=6943 RepID=A0AAQ4F145_AMBAM
MLRFTRATQRTRLLLVVVVAFTLLFICGVADDNDWGAVTRPAPATAPEERAGEAANKGGALSSAAAARSDSPLLEQRAVLDGRRLAVLSRGGSDDSSAAAASVAAVGMVHPEVVEGAAVWQGQAVTVVGLLGLTVFAVIVAVVGRKLYRSRRERRNGE